MYTYVCTVLNAQEFISYKIILNPAFASLAIIQAWGCLSMHYYIVVVPYSV